MAAPMEPELTTHGPVTSELCVRLATLLNDFNPAHYDAGFAASVGLPGVIAPGTLLQGWVAADIAARLQQLGRQDTARLGAIDLRFNAPVLLGDCLVISYLWDGDSASLTITASPDSAADSAPDPAPDLDGAGGDTGAATRTVATGTVRLKGVDDDR